MVDQKKIDETHQGVQEIKVTLAKFLVHQEQHRKEIDDLNLSQKTLEANQNKFFGASSVVGLGLTAFFAWLFNSHK